MYYLFIQNPTNKPKLLLRNNKESDKGKKHFDFSKGNRILQGGKTLF